MSERFVAEPMVYVRLIHSPDVFENVEYVSNNSFLEFNKNISPLIYFANFTSILVAVIGMFIALLWMNRFFKLNQINIEWWVWPTGCIASHFLFLMFFI